MQRGMTALAAIAFVLVLIAPALGQCDRQQWMPEIDDSDPRLAQPVRIEILGRAAVPGLALLSEKTGVDLRVAPENLETLGERKFTIIANGCSLKAIMVQLPEVLQECHWDIDRDGSQPVYLLHWEYGAAAKAFEKRIERIVEHNRKRHQALLARMDRARQALAMSPQELQKLRKEDSLLALTVLNPQRREILDWFLSLPSEKQPGPLVRERIETKITEAPPYLQQWVRESIGPWRELSPAEAREEYNREMQALRENFSEISIWLACDAPAGDGYPSVTVGYSRSARSHSSLGYVIPPVHLPRPSEEFRMRHKMHQLQLEWFPGMEELFAGAGIEMAEAERQIEENIAQGERKAERIREASRSQPDPLLQATVKLQANEDLTVVELQQRIAAATGLSIISDYWTLGRRQIPAEMNGDIPAEQVLTIVPVDYGDVGRGVLEHERIYQWRRLGDCLLFWHGGWEELLLGELPEFLLQPYEAARAERLVITVEGIEALADRLLDRYAQHQARLALDDAAFYRWARDFRRTLSPEQLEKAREDQGLPYSAMTPEQKKAVGKRLDYGATPIARPQTEPRFMLGTVVYPSGRYAPAYAHVVATLAAGDHELTSRISFRLPPDMGLSGREQ